PRRDRHARPALLRLADAVLPRRLHVRRARAAVGLTVMPHESPEPSAPAAPRAAAARPGATPSVRERRTRMLVTLVLLAANLVAFNALVAGWPGARLDLTADRSFSISPATRKLLGSLDDDLHVYGYFSKRTHPKLAPLVPQIEDLLAEYRALAHGRLHVELLDPGESDRG